MCRWLAYSGTPVLLEELLYKPQHSLIDQSLHSRLGRRDDERRRLRRRLVRRGRDARRLHSDRARLERPQPARARGARPFRARVRAHPRVDRHAGAADQLPSVPARALALDAQRRRSRSSTTSSASSMLAVDPSLYSDDRGLDRLGGVLLPRAHARARGRPARRRRARGRPHRGGRPPQRDRAPDPDDGGDQRRRPSVWGVPLLERGQVALALLLDR